MASLFIKDGDTADRVRRMARRLGSTQTEAVRRAMEALDRELPSIEAMETKKRNFTDLFDAWQKKHPLPPLTGQLADKAFFDRLWGEAD